MDKKYDLPKGMKQMNDAYKIGKASFKGDSQIPASALAYAAKAYSDHAAAQMGRMCGGAGPELFYEEPESWDEVLGEFLPDHNPLVNMVTAGVYLARAIDRGWSFIQTGV